MPTIVPVTKIDASSLYANSEDEKIDKAIWEDSETGDQFEGDNHKEANPYAPSSPKSRETSEYKFKTSNGRIVSRKTAYRIAKSANQLKRRTKRKVLHSGNLKK